MTNADLKQIVCTMNDRDAELNETLAKLKAENPIHEVQRPETFRDAL